MSQIAGSGDRSDLTPQNDDDVGSLNEAVAERDREIARLHVDRGELEEACASLKREVRDAWDSFTQAKDRSGLLEVELQECLSQLDELRGDPELAAAGEQSVARKQLESRAAQASQLEEDLRIAVQLAEQLRSDHATMKRQSEARLSSLEQLNAELTATLTDKQREISRLQAGVRTTKDCSSCVELRRRLDEAASQLEQATEKAAELRGSCTKQEFENHRLQRLAEEERLSSQRSVTEINRRCVALEEALATAKSASSSGTSPSAEEKVNELKYQVQNLSKQLLQKQTAVLELQAEKVAMKSQLHDLTARLAESSRAAYGTEAADDDLESNKYGVSHRKRRPEAASEVRRLQPIMQRAVSQIDSTTFIFLVLLRNSFLVRYGFLLYLLVLHLWVFFVMTVNLESI